MQYPEENKPLNITIKFQTAFFGMKPFPFLCHYGKYKIDVTN